MDLNKAVPPWRHKTWKKMHSNTMRMQNYAKLAVGTHQGYMAKHMSRCLHWSVTAEPAAFCAQAAIYIWGRNLKLLTKISSSPKVSPPPPLRNFCLGQQVRKPPLPNPTLHYENAQNLFQPFQRIIPSRHFTTLQPRGLFLVRFFFEKSHSNTGICESTPRNEYSKMEMHKTHFSGLFLFGILVHFNLRGFSWYVSFSKRAVQTLIERNPPPGGVSFDQH